MVDHLDADLIDADWIKPAYDDIRLTNEELEIMDIERLAELVALPAWEGVNDHQKAIADQRLAEIAD